MFYFNYYLNFNCNILNVPKQFVLLTNKPQNKHLANKNSTYLRTEEGLNFDSLNWIMLTFFILLSVSLFKAEWNFSRPYPLHGPGRKLG